MSIQVRTCLQCSIDRGAHVSSQEHLFNLYVCIFKLRCQHMHTLTYKIVHMELV